MNDSGSLIPPKLRFIAEALAVGLLVVLFYHPHLRFGWIQTGGDAANLFWPIKVLLQESLWGEATVPLWNPYAFLGSPLLATLQHAVFYPPAWLIYGIFPAHIGLNVELLFHLVMAGTGAWYWLRRGFRLSAPASIMGGAAFPCTAWFWGHQEHLNQIAAIAWFPWLAATAFLFLKQRRRFAGFMLSYSGLAALQFLSGHPQEAFYSHLFVLALLIGWFVVLPKRKGVRRHALKECIRVGRGFAAAGVLLLLLIAVQLLPTLEIQKYADRSQFDPAWPYSFSMPPDVLLTYLSPHHFGSFVEGYWVDEAAGIPDRRAYNEFGLFVGVPMLLLAGIGVVLSWRRRKFTRFLAIAGVVTLLLALGGNTDPRRILSGDFTEFPGPGWSLHDLYLLLLPPAHGLRVPARIVVLTAFCWVSLGAFGLHYLLEKSRESPALRKMLAVLVPAAVLAALYFPSRAEKFHYPADAAPMLARIELDREALATGRTLDRRLFRLTVGDDELLVRERHLEMTFAQGNPLEVRAFRLMPHMNTPARQPIVLGYEEGLLPTIRYKDFLFEFNRHFRQFQPDPVLLGLMGVERVYTDLRIDQEMYDPEPSLTEPGRLIARNPLARGAAFWSQQAEWIDLEALDSPWFAGETSRPRLGRRNDEIVDYGDREVWLKEQGRLRTNLLNVNTIEVVSLRKPMSPWNPFPAYLSLGWYPGWRFVPSGQDVEFVNAVHARLPEETYQFDPALPPGMGKWILQFQPRSYRIGLFLSGLGLALFACLTGIHLRQYPYLWKGLLKMEQKRIAAVTGANRGIGKEICRELAQQGITTILTARREDAGRAAAEELRGEGLDVVFHQLDAADEASIERFTDWVREEYGRLDILVNNAGVFPDKSISPLEIPLEKMREAVEVNTLGPLRLIQAVAPMMKKNGYGRIVNLSSQMGSLANMGGGYIAYRSTKTMLNAVTRVTAEELRGTGVLVNSMCPGWIKTEMGGEAAPGTVEEGADTAIWLATLPEDGPTGGYFQRRKPLEW